MVKVITLLKKKDELTHEEFSRYWEEQHGPLVARVFPGVRRYVQSHLLRPRRSEDPQIDGVAELWYHDPDAWRAAVDFYLSDEGKVIRDDEEKFIDRSQMTFIVVQEKVIKQ